MAARRGLVPSLAVALDKFGENAVWETIEEGFRAIIGVLNETSKRCMVADYFKRQGLPDREFQLLAGLLAASDEPILRSLLVARIQTHIIRHERHILASDIGGFQMSISATNPK